MKMYPLTRIKIVASTVFVCVLGSSSLNAVDDNRARQAYYEGHYKESIEAYNLLMIDASLMQKGLFGSGLAQAYYSNQEEVKALKTFIEALDTVSKDSGAEFGGDETFLEIEAKKMYFNDFAMDPKEAASKLRRRFATELSLHPEYLGLKLYLSEAYVNLEMFNEFFELFYPSYLAYPNHFLAQKIKGMLHLKLFQLLQEGAEKEENKSLAWMAFNKAWEKEPLDSSMYKLLFTCIPQEKKQESVKVYLQSIIQNNIVIPRSDVYLLTKVAKEVGDDDLAEEFVKKARSWYGFSRSLDAAEDLLKK